MLRQLLVGSLITLIVVVPEILRVPGAPAVVPLLQKAEAANRIYYVWYKNGSNGRYHGVGPYTYREAQRVADDYERSKSYYGVYIGKKNG
jgi:hypothetical protein